MWDSTLTGEPHPIPAAASDARHELRRVLSLRDLILLVIGTIAVQAARSAIGIGIVAAGIPAYLAWILKRK